MNKQDTKKELEALKAQVAKLEAAINEPEVVYGRQRVAEGGLFYYIQASGTISHLYDCYSRFEGKLFVIGNYYHTVAEAEKARDKQLAYMRIVDALAEKNGDWVADWSDTGQRKQCITYQHHEGEFDNDWWRTHFQHDGGLWGTKEATQYVIENHASDLKLVWEVE